MKLGICIEMIFTDRPFLDRIRLAADAGVRFAEMWFIDDKQPGKVAAAAAAAGVTITNTVIGSPDGSVGGGLVDPANRPQWLKRTAATLAFNKAAGIPATIVCTGNVIKGMTTEQMTANVIEGLKPTVELAEKQGVTLLLEPLNTRLDHAGYLVTGSDQGAAICRSLKSKAMRLLFDCYHMQIMEGDLVAHITKNIDVIGHFHSAGAPGRHELDQGEVNYPFVVRQIERLGYTGVFGLVYTPTAAHSVSLASMVKHLSALTAR
jgi:hydroxypyruvate isomerase